MIAVGDCPVRANHSTAAGGGLNARDYAMSVALLWPAPARVMRFLMGADDVRAGAVADAERFVDWIVGEVSRAGGEWKSHQIAMRAAAESARIAARGGDTVEAYALSRLAMAWSDILPRGNG